jgi:hypothetical protein
VPYCIIEYYFLVVDFTPSCIEYKESEVHNKGFFLQVICYLSPPSNFVLESPLVLTTLKNTLRLGLVSSNIVIRRGWEAHKIKRCWSGSLTKQRNMHDRVDERLRWQTKLVRHLPSFGFN